MNYHLKYNPSNFTQKIQIMFQEINRLNRSNDFLIFREKSLSFILSVCTFGGTAIIIIWHLFDYLRFPEIHEKLAILRISTILVFLANWFLSKKRILTIPPRIHLLIGLIAGGLFCSLLTRITGGSLSPNWFGMLFILVSFMIMPIPYIQIIFHSLLLIFINAIINIWGISIDYLRLGETHFLYTGFLIITALIAIVHNYKDALAFINLQALDQNLKKESENNRKLMEEMDLRLEVEKSLSQNRQYLQTILTNAPLIMWALDLDGKFLMSEGKGLQLINAQPGERVGKSVFELYPGDNEVARFARKLLKGEINDEIVTYNNTTFSVHTGSFFNEDGVKSGFIGIAFDISESTKAKNELLKYKRVIEQAPGMVVIFDKKGKIDYINPFFEKVTGYTLKNVKGKDIEEIIPDLCGSDRYREISETITSCRPWTGVQQHKSITGETLFFQVNAGPFYDNDGELQGYLAIDQDITELTKLGIRLSDSEQRFREIANFLPQIIFEMDLEGKIIFTNKISYDLLGVPEEMEVAGMPGINFFIQEDRSRMMENISEMLAGRRQSQFYEYTALRMDGKTFPVMISSTTFTKNGQVAGIRGLIIDISERKAMEEALLVSEEKYRHLIHSLQEGLFVISEGKFIFLNEAILNIVGYSTEELIGADFLSAIAPSHKDEVRNNHKERISGQKVISTYETLLQHKDGREIPAIISVTLTNFEGKPAVIGTARDITQRIKVEYELKKAKSDLENANIKLEKLLNEQSEELNKATGQLMQLQNKNLQTQFEFLKSQVNPHFLFNSLNVLVSLIKIEPDLAEKFTEQLAKAYRYIIENKDKDLVSVQTELDFLFAYIFLLNIRFKDKLNVEIDVSESVRDLYLVPLALQLLMENCIKHNTFSKAEPLNIKIYSDMCCYITVTNNLQIRQSHFSSTGVGLKNIESRYALITDNKPQFIQTETEFTARIPLIENI